jgi:hypothetical protein
MHPTPPQGTYELLVITVLVTAVLTVLFQKFTKFILHQVSRPFRWLWKTIYKWVAPRNPLSISFRTYRRHILRSNIARMEIPVGPALEVPLERAFAPLKLLSRTSSENTELFAYAADNRRFIVLGGAGTGKTTLMKSLIVSVLNETAHDQLKGIIPAFVVLRRLAARGHNIEEGVISSFDDHDFPGSDRFVRSAIDQGKMLIVLDGLDEVGVSRGSVVQQIRDFCERDDGRDNRNRLILTCRESSYRAEDLRDVIPDVVRVEPFANDHMRTFLSGWPLYRGRSAIKLYQLLQRDGQIRDICRNPLLLTILAGLYLESERFELPSSRERFYTASLDELLIRRPARRNIQQSFVAAEKQRILEGVALECIETPLVHGDPEEFDRDTLRLQAQEVLRRNFDVDELIRELAEVNGIIKQTRDQSYTFAHRTFQEFLAATELVRSRRTQDVLQDFSPRPELAQVLYFYCGLVRNIPQATDVVSSFAQSGDWQHAGKSLLYMTEPPDERLIRTVAEGLTEDIRTSSTPLANLETLTSLAQRPNVEFNPARACLSQVIDVLSRSNERGASSALASALSSSPDAALKVVPALLAQDSPEWRRAAVRLLRDIGTVEALDHLVQLLVGEPGPQKVEAARVLAGLLPRRADALRDRVHMLPLRAPEPNVWPLEKYFPGRVSLPIIETLETPTQTDNRAIKYAVRARTEGAETRFSKQWRNISRDVRLVTYRRGLGQALMGASVSIVILWFILLGLLTGKAYRRASVLIIRTSPVQVDQLPRFMFDDLREEASKVAFQIKKNAPPSKVWYRIPPWRWGYPELPERARQQYSQIDILSSSFQSLEPYRLSARLANLDELSPFVQHEQLAKLRDTAEYIRQHLPPTREKPYVVLTPSWRIIFVITILLTPFLVKRTTQVKGRLSQMSDILLLVRPRYPSRRAEYFGQLESLALVLTVGTQFLTGSLLLILGVPMIASACYLGGQVAYKIAWPWNPLLDSVEDVTSRAPSFIKPSSEEEASDED